ncbi:hypothetical protein [Streptomyces sp. LBL]|uniref:hypothetical protein n=1 Tax=Streptomyces sp. LBL TaxID=2940562 RepID=UPI002475BB65|nr:hypothetical protein [Streptomyces sp. LBL]
MSVIASDLPPTCRAKHPDRTGGIFRPLACHFAHHFSTPFSDTPQTAATSSRSRPVTDAATARNRKASCTGGD